MKTSTNTRVFHIDSNLGTATDLLTNQGARGWFEGQWWYINSVGFHGRADSAFVRVAIVPHGDEQNGCRQTDLDAILICAEEQSTTKVLARA